MYFTSILPDIVEPAVDYRHRGFFHSKRTLKFLSKYVKVKFVNDIIGKKAQDSIKNLKAGEVLLLENIRFEKDEFSPEKRKKNKLINIQNYNQNVLWIEYKQGWYFKLIKALKKSDFNIDEENLSWL